MENYRLKYLQRLIIKPDMIMSPPIPITMICRFLSKSDNVDQDFMFKPMKKPRINPQVIPMKKPICTIAKSVIIIYPIISFYI